MSVMSNLKKQVPVSVIFPTRRGIERIITTIKELKKCIPQPDEYIILVDGGDLEVCEKIAIEYPDIQVLKSDRILGPGGARNVLVEACKNEWIANFDDDSFPVHEDYFERVDQYTQSFQDCSILSATNLGEIGEIKIKRIAVASGCGCVFKKSDFIEVGGFVSMEVSYNMEEVDIGLRLFAAGKKIMWFENLVVKHDRLPASDVSAELNAEILANGGVLVFLRYPVWLWWIGVIQILSRIYYLFKMGWTQGVGKGIIRIFTKSYQYRSHRKVLPTKVIWNWIYWRRKHGN
jgi:GT2 family glycosyltransferase